MSEQQIAMEEKITTWKQRVDDLKEYEELLQRHIKIQPTNIEGELKACELRDKLYDITTEIFSKEQYIKTYEEDVKRQEVQHKYQVDTLGKEFGGMIDRLKKINTEHPKAREMRQGILDRAKKGYKQHKVKWQDFITAQEVIQHVEANPVMKAVK